jgi:hypothetical protein
MKKISVVIPTIWKPSIESIDNLINGICSVDIISEIILINNNPDVYSYRYSNNHKVKELRYNNIYVNQSWNVGVYQSQSDIVCLMNDDIQFNFEIFEFIRYCMSNNEVKIVGVAKSCYKLDSDLEYSIEKIDVRNRGWGCLIFVKKEFYTWIPNDLKIHFGDDYLIKQLSGHVYRITGLKISSQISTSVNSDPNFYKIIEEDNRNSLKYQLPWSNDYED